MVGEFPEVAVATKGARSRFPARPTALIEEPGATDTWRFSATQGQAPAARGERPADRLAAGFDDRDPRCDGPASAAGDLRCLAKTYVAFRDHDSRSPGIRLEAWSELAVNDYLLVGSELLRIRELPRNPDDDCQFFAETGPAAGLPGHDADATRARARRCTRWRIHPPGTTFPPNGLPVVTLFWRNDDGGPGFGKDSRLVFDPPADGDYRVRVADARGEGSTAHAYRLDGASAAAGFHGAFQPGRQRQPGRSAAGSRQRRAHATSSRARSMLKLANLPPGLSAPATSSPGGREQHGFRPVAEPTAKVAATSAAAGAGGQGDDRRQGSRAQGDGRDAAADRARRHRDDDGAERGEVRSRAARCG